MIKLIQAACQWGQKDFDGWVIGKARYCIHSHSEPVSCESIPQKAARGYVLLETTSYDACRRPCQSLEICLVDIKVLRGFLGAKASTFPASRAASPPTSGCMASGCMASGCMPGQMTMTFPRNVLIASWLIPGIPTQFTMGQMQSFPACGFSAGWRKCTAPTDLQKPCPYGSCVLSIQAVLSVWNKKQYSNRNHGQRYLFYHDHSHIRPNSKTEVIMNQKFNTMELTKMALLTALICVSAYIVIPLPFTRPALQPRPWLSTLLHCFSLPGRQHLPWSCIFFLD